MRKESHCGSLFIVFGAAFVQVQYQTICFRQVWLDVPTNRKKPLDKRGRKMYTNKADSRGVVRKRTELKANTWTVASRAEKRF